MGRMVADIASACIASSERQRILRRHHCVDQSLTAIEHGAGNECCKAARVACAVDNNIGNSLSTKFMFPAILDVDALLGSMLVWCRSKNRSNNNPNVLSFLVMSRLEALANAYPLVPKYGVNTSISGVIVTTSTPVGLISCRNESINATVAAFTALGPPANAPGNVDPGLNTQTIRPLPLPPPPILLLRLRRAGPTNSPTRSRSVRQARFSSPGRCQPAQSLVGMLDPRPPWRNQRTPSGSR